MSEINPMGSMGILRRQLWAVVSTLTYVGFVSAHILNSWFPIKKMFTSSMRPNLA